METPRAGAKDPAIGTFLSFLFPGLGHLYAGNFTTFLVFLGIELWLVSAGYVLPLVVLHLFQTVAAGGAVKHWNAKHGFTGQGGLGVPPPPSPRAGRAGVPPPVPFPETTAPPDIPPPPPPTLPPAVLDADAFLAELQAAWRDYRAGTDTARRFADRKWRAIRALRVEQGEGDALVAAARELSSAGVLTSEEIGQLAARIT